MRVATVIAALAAAGSVGAILNPDYRHQPHTLEAAALHPTSPSLRIPATAYKNLTYGVPIEDTATALMGQPFTVYNYYQIAIPVAQGFKIIVTPISGDVDLFVGDSTVQTPTYYVYNYSSASTVAEIVEVPPGAVTCGAGVPVCMFYIGVAPYSIGPTLYTIVATGINGPITLQDGIPVDGYLQQGDTDHYNISIAPASTFHSLTVSLLSWSGDPDIYVTLNDYSGLWPGPNNYQYAALGAGGEEMVVISFSSPVFQKACPPNAACNISISVYGYTAAGYTLTATSSGGYTQLIAGVPATGFVSTGQYAYFNFSAPSADNFTVFVTALSGDPDVYISATNSAPNNGVGNYTWSATTQADEVVPIKTTDAGYRAPPAWYIIGVYGWGGNISFSVLARMDKSSFTAQLLDGVPQAGISLPHSFSYFAFNMSMQYPLGAQFPGLDVALIPQQGDADLYISNLTTIAADGSTQFIFPQVICTYRLPSGVCSLYGANTSTYVWSSTNQGTQDFVSLPASSLYRGEGFVIGVLATSPNGANGLNPDPTVFSVVAATGATTMTLPTGVAMPGVVTAAKYKYYIYNVNSWGMDVVIAATVKSGGSLDIFVSEYYRPSNGNSTWNTTSSPSGILRDKYVFIPFLSLSSRCQNAQFNGETCVLMIAVQGYPKMGTGVESIYSISAQISGSPVYPYYLDQGSPIYTFIPAYAYEYFFSVVDITPDKTIYVTIQNVVGSTTLYMNLGNGKTFWTSNSPTPADAESPDVGGFERLIIPPPSAVIHSSKTGSKASQGRLSAVLRVTADATTGLIGVDSSDEEGVLSSQGGARVVGRMPKGGAVIAVPLSMFTLEEDAEENDEDVSLEEEAMDEVLHEESVVVEAAASPFVVFPRVASPVPIMNKGKKIGEHAAYSNEARRYRLGDKFRSTRVKKQLSKAREEERAALSAGISKRATNSPSLGAPIYCNSCMMYMTVSAGSQNANIVANFFGGATYVNLLDSIPMEGFSPAYDQGYYAISASDPTLDLTISVTQTFGQVSVYILVQQPTNPQAMPSSASYTWAFDPYAGVSSITLNHTDINFCVPIDKSTPGTPCTFLIAVYARNNETSTYTIVGSTTSQGLLPLFDGVPVIGQVSENTLQYYTFQASPPGYTVPQVILSWTNLLGSVVAYVTNQYVPGSVTSLLPGPTSTVCQWVATNYSGISMGPGDPCYNPNTPLYTIGIMGSTGFAGAVSRYEVTAYVSGDPTVLVYGVPTANIFIPHTLNVNFSFTVGSASTDLIVAATPTYGEVGLLVAHDDPTNNTQPYCFMACSGCIVQCVGYTWFMPSYGASPVLYINAQDPCHPIVPDGAPPVIVSPSCNASTSFRYGRYYAILYGFGKITEASLVVTQPGMAVTLPDGQPQDMQSGDVILCPSRDNSTGQCTGDSTLWTTNVQGAYFTVRLPPSEAGRDAYIILDRLCGNTTGYCGQPLHAYMQACRDTGPGACDGNAPYPANGNSRSDVVISDVQGSLKINYGSCGGFGTGDCLIYIGVYPICSGSAQPGVGCKATLFRASLSTDTGIERISTDCFASGSTCVLPESSAPVGTTKRYEAEVGSDTVSITVIAQVCSGTLNSYYCDAFNGNCNPVNMPGPANADMSAIPDIHGSATITATLSGGIFFLGVRTSAQTGLGSPTYQLTLQAGSGPLLVVSPVNPNVNFNRAPGVISVFYDGAYLSIPGTPLYRAVGATYTVYAFPVGATAQSRLDTPCGCDDAYANTAGVISAVTDGTFAQLNGVNPGVTYILSVVATCGAGTCMPNGQMAQRVALYTIQAPPVSPTASPSPVPTPAAIPAGPSKAGLSTAGSAAVAIVVLLGLGVGGFFGYRRFTGATGAITDSLPEFLTVSYWTQKFGGRGAYNGYSMAADGMFTSSDNSLAGGDMTLQNEGQDATYTAL